MKQATVATFLLLTAAATAVMAPAAAQTVWTSQTEMPGFLSQEDWCLMTPSPYSNNADYKVVPGCKSFVVKGNTITWPGRACKITNVSAHFPKSVPDANGNWRLQGHCSDDSVFDAIFFTGNVGGDRMLIQLLPPYKEMGD